MGPGLIVILHMDTGTEQAQAEHRMYLIPLFSDLFKDIIKLKPKTKSPKTPNPKPKTQKLKTPKTINLNIQKLKTHQTKTPEKKQPKPKIQKYPKIINPIPKSKALTLKPKN